MRRLSRPLLASLAVLLLALGAVPARAAPAADETSPPPLDTDPFKPPAGHRGAVQPDASAKKDRPWFVRPSLAFVARFSPTRSFLPVEGFGFELQAGRLLGSSTLRLALALGYSFMRVARTMDITVNSPELTSCTEVRSVSHHLAFASALGVATFSKVMIWGGLRGGFAYADLNNPNASCGTDEAAEPTGVIGPELGVGYALRSDLLLGLSAAYLHFFSKKQYTSDSGISHRFFYGMLTVGFNVTLRF